MSHNPPIRCSPSGGCPGDLICVNPEAAAEGTCVPPCDGGAYFRCENGSRCVPWRSYDGVCWPGGSVPEGATVETEYQCQFGLTPRSDYASEPFRYLCEPVCDVDAHCGTGERCSFGTCAVPCEGEGSVPCAAANRCILGQCVNERRFAQIDCNGDGEYVYLVGEDCAPGLVCDDSAIGGCSAPPPGEE